MDLTHRLRLPVSLDDAWAALNDPRRLAPVLPGAIVEAAHGDDFTGTFKVKLGPLALAFDGSGRYAERDEQSHRLVVSTSGRDRRGHGDAEATHTVVLTEDGAATDLEIVTELTVTGRPAQLGRGVVSDAADRIVDQLGGRVAARVSEGLPGMPEAEPVPDGTDEAGEVVEHPVELGATFGDVDEGDTGAKDAHAPAEARSAGPTSEPGPSPRPQPQVYEYKPFTNTAEPHVHAAKTITRLLVTRVAPYAGLGGLAVYAVVTLVRRARR